jgi:hypothetical protein
MGWSSTEFLQSAVDTCTNESGEQSDCALFTIQDEDTQRNCTVGSSLLDTVLKAEEALLLSALPGNVAIQWGPGYATAGAATGTTTTAASSSYTAPTLTYTPRPSTGGIYIEAASSSSASSVTTASSATTASAVSSSVSIPLNVAPAVTSVPVSSAQAPATTPAPTTSSDDVSFEVVSTEYRTTGALIEEIIWEEAVVYVTEDSVTTVTVQPQAKERRRVAGEHMLRHRHLHGHGHHHF